MDENLHYAATQMFTRLLKKEDEDYKRLYEECHDEIQHMFISAIEQEEAWADYLFKDGSVIGLNAQILKQYIRWLGSKRMGSVGIKCPYSVSQNNPLPWTESWITSTDLQVAPQETEISSYIIGGIEQDISTESFKGFSLD